MMNNILLIILDKIQADAKIKIIMGDEKCE